MRRKFRLTVPQITRPLSEQEAIAFRQDLRVADQEVQSYFRIYYIIGLIAVAAWLISPQSKPIIELMLGNGGYNIFAPIAIAFLNCVSLTYILYKSIEIHEIAQFISYGSKRDSAFVIWEQWRRSRISATRIPAKFYTPSLTLVPLIVSAVLLVGTYWLLKTPIYQLVEVISLSSPVLNAESQSSPAHNETSPAHNETSPAHNETATRYYVPYTVEQMKPIGNVFSKARWVLAGVALFHLVPVILILFNLVVVDLKWKRVWSKIAGIN